MEQFQIHQCYDSHVHLLAVGESAATLNLKGLKNPADFKQIKILPEFYRGEFLVGFGWDQHFFPNQELPTRQDLDSLFPSTPVILSRTDGHAAWVNTEALRRANLFRVGTRQDDVKGGEILRDQQGLPTGILVDQSMQAVYDLVPFDQSESDLTKHLLLACRYWNQRGFTHIRDMSGNLAQWNALCKLDQSNQWTLYADENFSFEKAQDFDQVLADALYANKQKEKHLRVAGLKFYLDGALGSEGAALSKPYGGERGQGLLIWQQKQVEEWIWRTWEQGLEIAIHAIGDVAAEAVVSAAVLNYEKGCRGTLNLEHGQVMSRATIQKLQGLQARIHMQPCHWLSDRRWLNEKLQSLYQDVFPWARLEHQGVPISFGSDAPIEEASIFHNLKALNEAAKEGISPMKSWELTSLHRHPNPHWGPDCKTYFSKDRIEQVVFDGKTL